ncbi:hypothetical protein [Gracilibacillus saliphilus]|uniref:hypothetical protein n=1 Tax=Gracilibacillus saliphilus TaxID=543890 RepID=UPI0013D076F4|nr:hypothetical protein [Gracilibacillus saliphilus]
MLQERVNQLKSAILEIDDKKVHVWGFLREDMLLLHLDKGLKCWSSQGLYEYQDLEFHNCKNNALFIIKKEGKEISRHQYKSVYKDTVKMKNEHGKTTSLTFTIRKSSYSAHYHFNSEKDSILFENKEKLDQYLLDKYSYRWES